MTSVFTSEIYRWNQFVTYYMVHGYGTSQNSSKSELLIWIYLLEKIFVKVFRMLRFCNKVSISIFDASIGIEDAEQTHLARVFIYSIRFQGTLEEMKEPLDFTQRLTEKST